MAQYDVVIIGAGLTGLLAAKEAIAAGLSVLVIERGDEYRPPEKKREQWWAEGTSHVEEPENHGPWEHFKNHWYAADKFHDLVENESIRGPWAFRYNMKYGVGGSAKVWSGMSWRFLPEDFACRSNFGHSADWPIDYKTIEPFYHECEQLMGVSGPSQNAAKDWPWDTQYPYPSFPRTELDLKVSELLSPIYNFIEQPHAAVNDPSVPHHCIGAKTCVQRCPTSALFHPDERWMPELLYQDNFSIVVNAVVTKLHMSPSGDAVRAVEYHDGESLVEVTAAHFILAANTIENILLLHRSRMDNGQVPANSSGLLGHYFASHGAAVLRLKTAEPIFPARGRPTHVSSLDPLFYGDRRQNLGYLIELWNTDFGIGYSPWSQYWRLYQKGHWGRSLFDQVGDYLHRCTLSVIFETEMTHEKYVVPSPRLIGKHGFPLSRIATYPTARDQRAQERAMAVADEIRPLPGIAAVDLTGVGLNGNHPLGGYRMSHDPTQGVVDEYCRAHDVKNLQILGGGVFCSTSAVNPSLTIAATTLRGVRHALRGGSA